MATGEFLNDLELGKKGEQFVRRDLESYGATYVRDNEDNDNKYDIVMVLPKSPKEVTLEVKTDVTCRPDYDTNNLFIEIECRGVESGIIVTEADYFITFYPYLKEIWYIKSDKLRDLIEDNDFELKSGVGDWNSNTKGYIIPRYQFREHFKMTRPKEPWE